MGGGAASAVDGEWRGWVLIGTVGLLIKGMVGAVLVGLHWFITGLHASTSADEGFDRSARASGGLVGV